MSLPTIPDITPIIDLDRDEALNLLLASIALEEMGLAHIINAEGEKLQHVLKSEKHKSVSIGDIKAINESIERIIRDVTKLQMLLQEKLENVISQFPKKPDFPCPQPPKRKPECILKGFGEGCVSNTIDPFYQGVALLESGICPVHDHFAAFSLKYTLCREEEDRSLSAVFQAIPESIEAHCPKKEKPCFTVNEPNMLLMHGQGIFAIKGLARKLIQCTATFTLKVWGAHHKKKFQMVISTPNPEFNHDSGVVLVTAGNLRIRRKRSI